MKKESKSGRAVKDKEKPLASLIAVEEKYGPDVANVLRAEYQMLKDRVSEKYADIIERGQELRRQALA